MRWRPCPLGFSLQHRMCLEYLIWQEMTWSCHRGWRRTRGKPNLNLMGSCFTHSNLVWMWVINESGVWLMLPFGWLSLANPAEDLPELLLCSLSRMKQKSWSCECVEASQIEKLGGKLAWRALWTTPRCLLLTFRSEAAAEKHKNLFTCQKNKDYGKEMITQLSLNY